MILMTEDIEKLKQEAIDAGLDIPEEPSGNDAAPDVAEIEEIDYGDGE